ncbi:hypothetical protein K2V74_12800 [Mammaliicoccus sciuri]|nr:hypothetical protein [Mammaliicoccus sciuri]MCD8875199.1 hypothetical protein [Mammaliicoccus sciuri]
MNYENAKQQKSSKLEIWNVSKEDLALNWYDLQDEEKNVILSKVKLYIVK